MKYSYVVFDFNGTVIDDVKLCYDLLNFLLKERGYKEVTLEDYKNIFTFPIKEYYLKAGFDFSKHSFESISKEFIELYQPESMKCNLFPNIKETLMRLNEKGVNVILLSASKKDNLLEQTNNFEITNLFKDVLGLDNIHAASKVQIAKDYFKNINKKQVLFIGDTLHDFEVSQEVGADCILVNYGHQSTEVLRKSGTIIVDDISKIFNYLGD